jgi:hypothetical protein
LILIEPAAELGVSVAKPEEIGSCRASGFTEAQLDDLELLPNNANEVARSDEAIGLDVLDQDSVKVGDQVGAGGERQGPTEASHRREAQIGLGDLEDLGEQALIEGPGLVSTVLPARQGDAKTGIGRQLAAIEAGLPTHGP